jgi:hypothetical protein
MAPRRSEDNINHMPLCFTLPGCALNSDRHYYEWANESSNKLLLRGKPRTARNVLTAEAAATILRMKQVAEQSTESVLSSTSVASAYGRAASLCDAQPVSTSL